MTQTQTKSYQDVASDRHKEGKFTTAIEERTARIPSDAFLWTAGAAIGTSLVLRMLNFKDASLFVGQWAPTILLLGTYNKLVKQFGHDRNH